METLLLSIIEGQERSDRKLDGIQNTVAHIEEEIVVMKGNIKVLQEDIQEVKGDIRVLREDMIIVKSDIIELKDTTNRIEEHQEKTIESMLRHIKKKVDSKLTIN